MIGTIEVVLNGEKQAVGAKTVAALLAELRLTEKKLAVEINREIVPRSSYADVRLNPGDKIEIVHFIGGG